MGRVTRDFITEQMVEMWHPLASNSNRPITGVLSGPMGVGKSHLALILSAKVYDQGWLIVYVSDANMMAGQTPGAIVQQICARFLAVQRGHIDCRRLPKIAAKAQIG
ncbi:hypothetical protein BG004_002915 [Podila humilis]|nr:hypothetical protein BG004_002915 [Podila humilis]